MRRSRSALALNGRPSTAAARQHSPHSRSIASSVFPATSRPSPRLVPHHGHPLASRVLVSNPARAHSASTMAANGTPTLKEVNYDVLDELRRFWFEHVEDEEHIVIPDMSIMKRFFMGGDEFDGACVKKFSPALEELRAQNITSSSTLLKLLPPRGPLDWLALLLLLDQVPRNCYRGDASGVVFGFFDPLALGVAQTAMEQQVFTRAPELRWNFSYRFWVLLPFIHSESLAIHDSIGPKIYEPLLTDVKSLIAGSSDTEDGSAERQRALGVLQRAPERGEFLLKGQKEQLDKHTVILRQFGRYPHRNGPMGREMRPEEQAYLDEGGDTFAPPKNEEERAKWEAAREAERQGAASG